MEKTANFLNNQRYVIDNKKSNELLIIYNILNSKYLPSKIFAILFLILFFISFFIARNPFYLLFIISFFTGIFGSLLVIKSPEKFDKLFFITSLKFGLFKSKNYIFLILNPYKYYYILYKIKNIDKLKESKINYIENDFYEIIKK